MKKVCCEFLWYEFFVRFCPSWHISLCRSTNCRISHSYRNFAQSSKCVLTEVLWVHVGDSSKTILQWTLPKSNSHFYKSNNCLSRRHKQSPSSVRYYCVFSLTSQKFSKSKLFHQSRGIWLKMQGWLYHIHIPDTLPLRSSLNNVESELHAWPYMLSLSLIWCKTEALKKMCTSKASLSASKKWK